MPYCHEIPKLNDDILYMFMTNICGSFPVSELWTHSHTLWTTLRSAHGKFISGDRPTTLRGATMARWGQGSKYADGKTRNAGDEKS